MNDCAPRPRRLPRWDCQQSLSTPREKAIVANSLAGELTTYLSWLPKDRFALTDPSANALLVKTISLVGNPAAAVGRSIPAKGIDNTSVVVHLIPTTRIVRDLLDGGHVLLVFSRVTTPAAPDLGVIRGLFDLTAAEARVATSLTEGLSPTEIALQNGVSVETVRSQIKSYARQDWAQQTSATCCAACGAWRPSEDLSATGKKFRLSTRRKGGFRFDIFDVASNPAGRLGRRGFSLSCHPSKKGEAFYGPSRLKRLCGYGTILPMPCRGRIPHLGDDID